METNDYHLNSGSQRSAFYNLVSVTAFVKERNVYIIVWPLHFNDAINGEKKERTKSNQLDR